MSLALEASTQSAAAEHSTQLWPQASTTGLSLALLSGLWIYVGGMLLWVLMRRIAGDPTTLNSAMVLVPAAIMAIGVIGLTLRHRSIERPRFIAWALLIAALAIDIPAIIDWSHWNETAQQPMGTLADVLYLINYGCLSGAAMAFYRSCGGSFRNSRVWIDTAVLIVCASAALAPFLVKPLFDHDDPFHPRLMAALVYVAGIGATGTGVIMLFMQVRDWRYEVATLIFILALLIGVGTDAVSIGANIRGQFDLFNLDDCAYSLVYALFATAAVVDKLGKRPPVSAGPSEDSVYSFLPVLAILLSIVIVLGAEARRSSVSIVVAAVLLFVGSALVVARQMAAREKVRRLNEALMARQVETRLTELVRQSRDMIAVITPSLRISYSSPACEKLLGTSADQLVGMPARQLLGAANADRLQELLTLSKGNQGISQAGEFTLDSRHNIRQTVQVSTSNQINNPLLGGLVLTVHDVSEQRATERELLEAVQMERQRLSSELHEGLGQELTGIYLLAQNLRTALQRGHADLPDLVEQTIVHVRDAIDGTRTLARDFSPVQVARGSLGRALEQLALDASQRLRIAIACRSEPADASVPDGAADHLYRIAHEALTNAARHSRCSKVNIVLQREAQSIILSVADNGTGFDSRVISSEGLGIKMMDYRARVLSGTLHFEPAEGGGTRLVVLIPTHSNS